MASSLQDLLAAASVSAGPAAVPVSKVSPGGVDPLGLRQINFRLMDMVLPGLNNVASRIRPFVLMTWAWRRVWQLVERKGRGGETDERLRDFVDWIEAIYAWSQFLVLPEPRIPGGQALHPLISSEKYRFGGAEWHALRGTRRSSTGLISPLNYGPGLRSMNWLMPVGPPASPLTGTDPLLLIESDPASAHRFVVSGPSHLMLGLPLKQLFLCSIAGSIPPSRPEFRKTWRQSAFNDGL